MKQGTSPSGHIVQCCAVPDLLVAVLHRASQMACHEIAPVVLSIYVYLILFSQTSCIVFEARNKFNDIIVLQFVFIIVFI